MAKRLARTTLPKGNSSSSPLALGLPLKVTRCTLTRAHCPYAPASPTVPS